MREMHSLNAIAAEALASLGRQRIAYVKRAVIMGREVFAVYAADGQHLSEFSDRGTADVVLRQNDLEPYSVH